MPANRLLLPVLGEPTEEALYGLACNLVRPSKGTVYAIYVVEVPRQLPVDAELPEAAAKGEEVLKRVESEIRERRCLVVAELLQARHAGAAIVKEAVEREADQILLGATYKERFGTLALGRTIAYVLQEAPCTVLVARVPIALRHPAMSRSGEERA
ncbi:MAG: universal stress protein [SAR202 cluster bacterium]|nr:universal stress protein [SAR202 cluster bacterium]